MLVCAMCSGTTGGNNELFAKSEISTVVRIYKLFPLIEFRTISELDGLASKPVLRIWWAKLIVGPKSQAF